MEKTIRTWSGIKLVEKKGMLITNAVILSEEKKNSNITWYKFSRSRPGKVKLFMTV
tara:strand:+ start:2489 stop:2656 length:168 start_codon:yes stop_codon:yes gene_type:complete